MTHSFFFFHAPTTTEIYTLSLHDALPILINGIDHINLVVDDLEAMTRFYETALGLKLTKRATITGQWIDETVGLKNVKADVVYLDPPSGPRIELIKYHSPGTSEHEVQPPNAHGFR